MTRDCVLSYVRYDIDLTRDKSNVMDKDEWQRTHRDEFCQSDIITQIIKEAIFLPDSGSPGNHRRRPNDKALLIYRFINITWKSV
jgi:hypothetical protein